MSDPKFKVREYLGYEIGKFGAEGELIGPLFKREDIQDGDRVAAWEGAYGTVAGNCDYIEFDGGSLIGLLEFDKDDRHCWVCAGCGNIRSIMRLELYGGPGNPETELEMQQKKLGLTNVVHDQVVTEVPEIDMHAIEEMHRAEFLAQQQKVEERFCEILADVVSDSRTLSERGNSLSDIVEIDDKMFMQNVRRAFHEEPTREEMLEALGDKDEAFLGGTIRRCIDCGEPIFGGPTRCEPCVEKLKER